jgi:hypothetical protein
MAQNVKNKVLPLLAIVLWLITSWGFDEAKTALKNYRSSTFNNTNLWVDFLIELVFAGLVLLLVWLVLFKFKKSALLGWSFVVIGLLAFYLSTPYRTYLTSLFTNIEIPPRYLRDDYPFFMQTYFSFIINFSKFLRGFSSLGFVTKASALTLALGVANIFRKPH